MIINFYGIVYFLGILAFYLVLRSFLKSERKDKDLAYESVVFTFVPALIMSRIFFIIFYSGQYSINSLGDYLNIWAGGLSIHGGLLGGIIGLYLFSKKNSLSFYKISDRISVILALVLCLGRIANFLNGEIIGKPFNSKLCLNIDNYCRHPVSLYLALKNGIIAFTLFLIQKNKLKEGNLTLIFLLMYFGFRFLIDFTREYSWNYLGLGLGQYFSAVFFIVLGLIFIERNLHLKRPLL